MCAGRQGPDAPYGSFQAHKHFRPASRFRDPASAPNLCRHLADERRPTYTSALISMQPMSPERICNRDLASNALPQPKRARRPVAATGKSPEPR